MVCPTVSDMTALQFFSTRAAPEAKHCLRGPPNGIGHCLSSSEGAPFHGFVSWGASPWRDFFLASLEDEGHFPTTRLTVRVVFLSFFFPCQPWSAPEGSSSSLECIQGSCTPWFMHAGSRHPSLTLLYICLHLPLSKIALPPRSLF